MCLTKLAPGTIAVSLPEARKRKNADKPTSMAADAVSSTSFNVISDSEHEPACDTVRSSNSPTKIVVTHEYHDHAYDRDPTDGDGSDADSDDGQGRTFKQRRGPRGGVAHPFPEKLHLMLSNVEQDGLDHIVSWHPHGRSFAVHKPKEFVAEVMPRYFKQTKLTSFQRQLNLYGFCRLTSGKDRGGYFHELFLRDRLFLCDRMMRTRIKGTGTKASMNPDSEPDFYQMPFVLPLNQTPREPPTHQMTWKITFSKKLPEKKPTTTTRAMVKRVVAKQRQQHQHQHRRVSMDEGMMEPDLVQSESSEPSVVAAAVVPSNSVQAAEPCCFSRPSSYPNILPLCMPVLPAETTTSTKTSMTVTPPQTPVLEDDIAPPPPELPNDDWLLSDSFFPDEALVFEGKTFHYLDASSFDCLQQDTDDRGARANDEDCNTWGFSMKDSDAFFAGM